MYKVSQRQCVFEYSFSEKGMHTINQDNAAKEAYKKIIPSINDKIKQQINK